MPVFQSALVPKDERYLYESRLEPHESGFQSALVPKDERYVMTSPEPTTDRDPFQSALVPKDERYDAM